MNLGRLLHPRSIAVVGATERPGSYGSEAILNLARFGFPGPVHAINPGRRSVHGVPCVPSLAELPQPADAVVIAIPAAGVADVIDEAGALGCGGAVVFAAGFGEAATGGERQAALAARARQHGIPVCGPNGNGIVSFVARAPLWGDMVAAAEPGPVALVSASGNIAVNALASRRGLRWHSVVSCGNQAVVTAEEWLAALVDSAEVRSAALYLEGEGDGVAWCAALERCARAGVGVAVLKAGSSDAGVAAASAHTGAVAGDQRAFRALVEECGGAWAEDPHELLELAKSLAAAGTRRGGPAGTGVMTCSGADAGITADIAAAQGVPLPPLTPETRDALSRLLPDAATAQNPLDYTSLLWDEPAAIEALVAELGSDRGIGRVLALYDEPAELDGAAVEAWTGVRRAIAAGAARCPVPVIIVATLPELLSDEAASALTGAGLPAVAGIGVGVRCARALATPVADPRRIAAIGAAAARRFRRPCEWLAEHEVKELLAEAGLPVVVGRLVADDDDAVAALSELGGPIALKLSARGLRHKSELDAVRLGLDDAARVRDEAASLHAMMSGGAGLLAERMAPAGVELLIAVRADAVVPVLVVGLGGVWTEALDDVALAPLPVSPARAERCLRSLRGAGVLLGGRGCPEVDVAAAARLASGVGALLLERGLALLELNPVVVHEAGATIVDALAVTGAGFEAAE